ncbi:MAG: hypothetical protein ABL955_00870 [Elusimicrobiota bacterium]
MTTTTERLESRLRESALIMLRRHGFSEGDFQLEPNEAGQPPSCLIRAHRVRIQVDELSAAFKVRAGRWSGARVDFPTAGAYIASFEEALHDAFAR